MANHYTAASLAIDIPGFDRELLATTLENARKQIQIAALEESLDASNDAQIWDIHDFPLGYQTEISERDDTLYVYEEGDFEPEHVEILIRALMTTFPIDKPIMATWAYFCSKPRPDQFGGGGFIVWPDKPTEWFNIDSVINDHLNKRTLEHV